MRLGIICDNYCCAYEAARMETVGGALSVVTEFAEVSPRELKLTFETPNLMKLFVAMMVSDGRVVLDFTGLSAQMKGMFRAQNEWYVTAASMGIGTEGK